MGSIMAIFHTTYLLQRLYLKWLAFSSLSLSLSLAHCFVASSIQMRLIISRQRTERGIDLNHSEWIMRVDKFHLLAGKAHNDIEFLYAILQRSPEHTIRYKSHFQSTQFSIGD